MNTCKNLIGTLFIYNDKPSKIEKKETKKKIKYFRYDCDYFGNITNERGVEQLEDDRLDRGIISFETIDTFENIKKHIIELGVEPKWYEVDEGCATLIKLNGNPEIIEDRIAFIEKSPRICINKKWFCGPKGDGHECGAYEPSRSWIVTTLLKINDLNDEKSEKLVTR